MAPLAPIAEKPGLSIYIKDPHMLLPKSVWTAFGFQLETLSMLHNFDPWSMILAPLHFFGYGSSAMDHSQQRLMVNENIY